ncbi:MAG: RpiB/LacA/LacB family sugar-phosphate isomerase [Patescibacteria group bacterium]
MNKGKLYLAADHAGFEYKNILHKYFEDVGLDHYEVIDLGAFVYNESDDYPDIIARAGLLVSANPTRDKAIIFGGSGQGEAIVANKFAGVRAVVYYGYNHEIIALSREHNDANVLSIGARFVNDKEMVEAANQWLGTPFSDEKRHKRRIDRITTIEKNRAWRFLERILNRTPNK